MLDALTIDMKAAACSGAFPAAPTAVQVWGVSIKEILAKVGQKALELGREYRDEIEQAAKAAIDAVVAWDLPGIPPVVEQYLDDQTRVLGYKAVEAVLAAILNG